MALADAVKATRIATQQEWEEKMRVLQEKHDKFVAGLREEFQAWHDRVMADELEKHRLIVERVRDGSHILRIRDTSNTVLILLDRCAVAAQSRGP